jgi:hypothetical protein
MGRGGMGGGGTAGPPMGGGGMEGGPGGGAQMRERMMEASSLKLKGKDPVKPERIEMVDMPEGRMLCSFFRAAMPLKPQAGTFRSRPPWGRWRSGPSSA